MGKLHGLYLDFIHRGKFVTVKLLILYRFRLSSCVVVIESSWNCTLLRGDGKENEEKRTNKLV